MNAFGTQSRDLIISGHPMAVDGISVDAVAESESSPVCKYQIPPECGLWPG